MDCLASMLDSLFFAQYGGCGMQICVFIRKCVGFVDGKLVYRSNVVFYSRNNFVTLRLPQM